MNFLLKTFYVLTIIIGGWIYIIVNGKPVPVPDGCIVCGPNLIKILSVILVAIGLASIVIMPRAIKEYRNLK